MNIGRADTDHGVALIAEIGLNHEGSMSRARDMIFAASEAGADAVKLQSFIPDLFAPPGDAARKEQLERFGLSWEETASLMQDAAEHQILVFSTPLDIVTGRRLITRGGLVKISSGDLTFRSLTDLVASSSCDMILSTGAAFLSEIHLAVSRINKVRADHNSAGRLALLHCVSRYPTHHSDANLRVISKLRSDFPNVPIGFSDHCHGIDVSLSAVAAGAVIIEKHFTLDKNLSTFRDHQLSATPGELRQLRSRIDMVWESLGSDPLKEEIPDLEMRSQIRRSAISARAVKAGTVIMEDDVVFLRPGTAIPPDEVEGIIGKRARKDISKGSAFDWKDLI